MNRLGTLVVDANDMRFSRRLTTAAVAIGGALSLTLQAAPQGSPAIHMPASVPVASTNPIASLYPKQWNAKQGTGSRSRHWALLIGITTYASPTQDTVGGKKDAVEIKRHLRSLGWREDHILLLANRRATKRNIMGALNWLKSKTNRNSTVVFSYAGHEMPFRTTADGDNETRDVALHTTDNRYILDGILGKRLGAVRSKKMWVHFATCRAQGFNDQGTIKANRVVTYSSLESQLSYEDPAVGQSVFGNYAVTKGMREKMADANNNGAVSVEEAFVFAKPLTRQRTSQRQRPVMVDRYSGQFNLRP